MIFILLAAQFGAAQEAIVVYEGAETSHNVDNHTGSNYLWEVYKSFNPEIEADPTEFYFTATETTNSVTVNWLRAGIYYLQVTETDIGGCSNTKALAISVVSNNRSIGFTTLSSSECYQQNNGFSLTLDILNNTGLTLAESYFPIEVSFNVDGIAYAQSVDYNKQEILIDTDMLNASSETETNVAVEITQAIDNQNGDIQPSDKKLFTRTIYTLPEIEFTSTPTQIIQGTTVAHSVNMTGGNSSAAIYSWIVQPDNGTSSDLSTIEGNSASIFWDRPLGSYSIAVSAIDGNGCFSDTIVQQIEIVAPDELIVNAGSDTTIASCNSFTLQASVSDTSGLSYTWEPADNLDNPSLLNPVFTPGNSTEYTLTITTINGEKVIDTVLITVSELSANAGDDIVIDENASAILNATSSAGIDLQYSWTTTNGNIESGSNTANPIVNATGTYYLEITDLFGCSSSDSIVVSRITYAPVANNDYDTTTYETAVSISVLANDIDQDNTLDPTSLSIEQYPENGDVYVNYNDYTITYTPDNGFEGNDVFEYQICNLSEKCDYAYVYVVITPVDFFIPDAFTPNGDNINDYFEIAGIEYYTNNSLTIVNRWGKQVYTAKNYGIDTTPTFWDGKWNNEDLPTGTYFYILNLGNGQKSIAGSVYIDR
jgi:gliding motility-associated-like protein